MKGNTVSGGSKSVQLETGATISVSQNVEEEGEEEITNNTDPSPT